MQIEPHYEDRIDQLLERRGWATDDLNPVFEHARTLMAEGRLPPHSLHFTVESSAGDLLHLRVLIWRSVAWRKRRAMCIEHHRALAELTAGGHHTFHVPRILASGTSPLIWDVSEHVEGSNLPWVLDKHSGLAHETESIPQFIDIAVELASMRTPRTPRRNLQALAAELQTMASWAKRAGIINREQRHDVMHEVRRFDRWVRPQLTNQLAHGDFNPGNVLFRGQLKPWLIDFDDLRLSVPGDSLGRLFAITYNERRWSRSLFKTIRREFDDGNYESFRIMAYWHLFNFWQQMMTGTGAEAASLAQLENQLPWAAKQITKSGWTLDLLLDSLP